MNPFTYMTDRDFSQGRKYIGASDWPTLAGVNDYKTPYDFWAEWTGRKESFKGNPRTDAGHRQEPIILGEYIRRAIIDSSPTGEMPDEELEKLYRLARRESVDFIISRLWGEERHKDFHSWTEAHLPDNPRIVAHADLLDLTNKDYPIIIQAKNTGQFAADTRKRNPYKGYSRDDLSQNGIPIGVYLQEQGELMCYGLPRAYVAVQIDGWDNRIYGPVEYRKKDAEKLLVLGDRMLWHIDKDIPPTPKTWPDVLSIFPDLEKGTKSVVSEEDEIDARVMIAQRAKIQEKIRVLKNRNLDIEMALAVMASEPSGVMRNYLTTSDGSKLASFSDRAGNRRIDLSRLEKEFPELARQIDEAGLISQDNASRMIYISGAPAGSVNLWTLVTYDEEERPKRSRKKYTSQEKKEAAALLESCGVRHEWEKYTR